MKRCPNCGAQIADDSRFCTECGKPIPQGNVCPHCGASFGDGAVFCSNCGKRLDEEPTPIVYDEEETDNGFKKYLPYIIGAVVLLGIIGYYTSNEFNLGNDAHAPIVDTMTVDSDKAMEIVPISKEKLEKIISPLVCQFDYDLTLQIVNKVFTERYKTYYNRACEKADKEGQERPRIWWQFSDSDPDAFTIDKLEMTANEKAKALVIVSSELHKGRFEVLLNNENGDWLIDKITELDVVDLPVSETTDGENEGFKGNDDSTNSSYHPSSSRTFANEQYVVGFLLNQTFTNYSNVDIRFDGDGRMYIDGDYAGVVSVLRYNETSALLRYGGGMYGEGKIGVRIEDGRLQLRDPIDGTVWYQK